MTDIGGDSAPVGGQFADYATQVAALNQKIDGLSKGGLLPSEGDGATQYQALKSQRDSLTARGNALSERAKKAGGGDFDFVSEVKQATQKLKTPAAPKEDGGGGDPEPAAQTGLEKFKAEHGDAYKDLSDQQILDGLYKNHYSDMPREDFDKKMGVPPPDKGFPYDNPAKDYGSVLPLATDKKTGKIEPAVPEMIRAPLRGAIDIGKKVMGKEPIDPRNPVSDEDRDALMAVSGIGGAGRGVGAGMSTSTPPIGNRIVAAAAPKLGGLAATGAAKATEAVGKGAIGAVKGIPKAIETVGNAIIAPGRGAKNLYNRARGTEAKEAIGKVRDPLLKQTEAAAASEEAKAAAAGTKAGDLSAKESRLREATAARTNELTAQYEAAGKSTEEARTAAQQHATLTNDAKTAVETMDKDLAAKPGVSKQDFGTSLAKATRDLEEKYTNERAEKSGYTKALSESAQSQVDTSAVRKIADDWLKKTTSLTDDPILEKVKRKLITEINGEAHDVLTVEKADSLRKVLNEITTSKVFGDSAVDHEAAKAVGAVRDALKDAIDEATPALKAARAKWAELSTPLNIVSEKGPLGKVVELNPRTRDAKMAGAEIAGHVIREANDGHEVFSRLIAETPQLRESARLYFTQDLFGQGRTPTVGALKTWLKTNENSLRQLGLYDEFSSVANAKAAAQRAVKEATGTQKLSAAAEKLAEKREGDARTALERSNKMRGKVLDRVGGAKEAATKEAETASSEARDYKGFVTRLSTKVDKQVPQAARDTLKKLYDDKRIEDKAYKEMLEAVNEAEAKGLKRDELRNRIKNIVYTATAAAVGYEGYRGVRALTGW